MPWKGTKVSLCCSDNQNHAEDLKKTFVNLRENIAYSMIMLAHVTNQICIGI